MANYVILNDGTDSGNKKGLLTPVVQGSLITIIIDVQDAAGNDFDITGATSLVGRMDNAGTVTSISGTLSVSGGGLSWDVSAGDVGTAGYYSVIFQFVLSGDTYKTYPALLFVRQDPAATAVQNSAAATWATSSEANLAAGTADDLASFDADGILEDSGINKDAVVTTTGTQTLTNKTLNDFSNTIASDELHIQVRNDSGGPLTVGTPVYITGYNVGQDLVTVDKADASGAATMPCVAVISDASISDNSNGAAIVSGRVKDLDTSSFSVGNELYVSETAGTFTTTEPLSPAISQKVAVVLRSHATLGIIEVFGAGSADTVGASAIDDLTDVTITGTPADNELLAYDTGSGEWINQTAGEAGLGTGDVTGPASSVDNEIPRFDSTTGKILQAGTDAPIYTDDGRVQVKSGGTVYGGIRAVSGAFYLEGSIPGTSYTPLVMNALSTEIRASGAAMSKTGRFTSVGATPQTVIANGTGDVSAVISGTYAILDSAANVAGGVITATQPSGTFNLYDDGGTNTCQLQVAADGSVVVVRTAGARTYTVTLNLIWI